MADDTTIGITAEGDLDGFQQPRLILTHNNCRWWSTVLKQVFCEKKIWGHVQGTVAASGPALTLNANVTHAELFRFIKSRRLGDDPARIPKYTSRV